MADRVLAATSPASAGFLTVIRTRMLPGERWIIWYCRRPGTPSSGARKRPACSRSVLPSGVSSVSVSSRRPAIEARRRYGRPHGQGSAATATMSEIS